MKTMGILAGTAALACAAPAFAQTTSEVETTTTGRAPSMAFEMGVDAGYTQGIGALYGNRAVGDLAGPGLGVGVTLGYRASPGFSIGLNGQYQGMNPVPGTEQGSRVRGATAGVEATFHTAPHERADPWLSLGTGYRMLWEMPPGDTPSTLTHGFQLGKVQLGVDIRPSDSIALSPVIGGDLDMFVWQTAPRTGRTEEVTNRGVSGFVFAGVKGRFDLGGARLREGERVP